MNRPGRRLGAATTCPVCRAPVGLVKTTWNGGRNSPKTARHKPVPGGPWCPGSGLAVPPASVVGAAS